jgi:hypothetical protein
LKINDKKFKIIGDTELFENYNYNERTIRFPVFSNITNISLLSGKYYEKKSEDIKIDENTAHNNMKVKLYDELLKMCNNDSKILNTSLNFEEDDNNYYLNAQIEILEDIGETIKIFPTEAIDDEENEEIKED